MAISENMDKMLRHPQLMGRTDFFELESLLLEKPWFTAGHVLLARAAKNIGHPGYQRFVERARHYTTDHAGLYHFLEKGLAFYPLPMETQVQEEPEPEIIIRSVDEFLTGSQAQPAEIETMPEMLMDDEPETIAPAELAIEITENEETTAHETAIIPAETTSSPEPKADKKFDGFFAWLQHVQSQNYLPRPQPPANTGPVRHGGPKPAADEQVTAIIDRFIEINPTITRSPRKMFNPVEYSRISDEYSHEIITETLAKVYAEQKLYSKAIQIYEKLQLIKPDKKDIFAARILDLQQEINS